METDIITLLLCQFKDNNLLKSLRTQNQEALQCFCSCRGKVGLGAWWKDTFQPFCLAFLLARRAHVSFGNRRYSIEIKGAGRGQGWNLRVVLNCNSCWFLWRWRGYFQALMRACKMAGEVAGCRILVTCTKEENNIRSLCPALSRSRRLHQQRSLLWWTLASSKQNRLMMKWSGQQEVKVYLFKSLTSMASNAEDCVKNNAGP